MRPPELNDLAFLDEVRTWLSELLGTSRVDVKRCLTRSRHALYFVDVDGRSFYLKLHQNDLSYQQELHSYLHWRVDPHLFSQLVGGHRAPTWRGLLLTPLPGQNLEEIQLVDHEEQAVWLAAGRLAARFHGQSIGEWFGVPNENGLAIGAAVADPVEYARQRLNEVAIPARAQQLLTNEEVESLDWADLHCEVFAGEVPRPVNPDYAPGNWLVQSGKFSGTVDLEEARWGLRVEAFSQIWAKYCESLSNNEAAFFEGYGWGVPHLQVRFMQIRTAIANIVYGTTHGSQRHVSRGRRLFQRQTSSRPSTA